MQANGSDSDASDSDSDDGDDDAATGQPWYTTSYFITRASLFLVGSALLVLGIIFRYMHSVSEVEATCLYTVGRTHTDTPSQPK